MFQFIKVSEPDTILSFDQLKRFFRNASLSNPPSKSWLADRGFGLVVIAEAPEVATTQEAVLGGVEASGDKWIRPWVVRDRPQSVIRTQVNAERDRRLQSGLTFNGVLYQSLDEDVKRITGAATLAGFAVGAGSPVGNLRWANADKDFGWIAMDNSVTPMDAQTMFAFGQAAAANESAHVFAARTLKNMDPIPVDFADDKWWP